MRDLFMTGAQQDEVWPLVRDFHYSRKMPSAVTHCFAWREAGGLFGDYGDPLAAAIYGQPTNRNWPQDAIELLRLVRSDKVERPISQFLAWTLRWLRSNTDCQFALSYADTAEGHHGGIYQATGWVFVGSRTEACPAFLLPDGSKKHSRQVNRELGSRSIDYVRMVKPDWLPVKGEAKNLYIWPLRKKLKPILRDRSLTVQPYPKIAARPADELATCQREEGATPSGRSNRREAAE